jgi:hypothetical protein
MFELLGSCHSATGPAMNGCPVEKFVKPEVIGTVPFDNLPRGERSAATASLSTATAPGDVTDTCVEETDRQVPDTRAYPSFRNWMSSHRPDGSS